jgi:hypothetical protein
MSVQDYLAAGKYENKVPYTIDVVPVDEERMTVREAAAHKEAEKQRARDQKEKHNLENRRLLAELRADLEA